MLVSAVTSRQVVGLVLMSAHSLNSPGSIAQIFRIELCYPLFTKSLCKLFRFRVVTSNMNRSIRIMHFADTHFGIETYGKNDVSGINSRLQDFKHSLEWAVKSGMEEGIDIAVFAGDAYKNRDPKQTEQREFANCITMLTQANIPVVLVMGDLDMPILSGRASSIDIFDTLNVSGIHIFTKPGVKIIETRNGPIQIAAIPYQNKTRTIQTEDMVDSTTLDSKQKLEAKYTGIIKRIKSELSLDTTIPTLLVGHFWTRGANLSQWQQSYLNEELEPQVNLNELTGEMWDYVALGHIHTFQDLNSGNTPPVIYSGSPYTMDFGETGEKKGYVLADVQKGATSYKFIPIEVGRQFLDIVVTAICEDPTQEVVTAIQQHKIKGQIVRLTVHLNRADQSFLNDKVIRDALSSSFYYSVIRKISKDKRPSPGALSDGFSPAKSLSTYIDSQEGLKSRKDRLMEAAERLIAELSEAEDTQNRWSL